ncbi:MAG: redox-regulated ATPase YchF [Nanoarchaeota archaeon]
MLIGIVGKPSCGKSTFFKAATLAEVEIADYPFTTIKPNHAVGFVRVPCAETFFNTKCNPRVGYCVDGQRFVPVDMLDVAGLIPGAHKGEGLGLEFLNDLNQADMLIHVIDASGSINVRGEPVQPLSYDPLNDVKFLEEELDYWYLGILKKGWDKLARHMQLEKAPVQILAKQLSGLGCTELMVKGELERLHLDTSQATAWDEAALLRLASALRRRTKPMIIAANKVDVPGAEKNVARLKEAFPDYTIIPCSAEAELALKQAAKAGSIRYLPGDAGFEVLKPEALNERQQKALAFIQAMMTREGSTGIQKALNAAVFDVLKFIAIFPGGMHKLEDQHGNRLPDCFLIPGSSTALDFAFRIHTDLGQHFIRAIDVKKRQTVGKEHKLQNLDVIEIITDK